MRKGMAQNQHHRPWELTGSHSVKVNGKCYWDQSLIFHSKKLRKLCLPNLLKQPKIGRKLVWKILFGEFYPCCTACREGAELRVQHHLSLVSFDSVLLLKSWMRRWDMLIKFVSYWNLWETPMLLKPFAKSRQSMELWLHLPYLYLSCTLWEHNLPLIPSTLSVRSYFPLSIIISHLCFALVLVLPHVLCLWAGQEAAGHEASHKLAKAEGPAGRPGKISAQWAHAVQLELLQEL